MADPLELSGTGPFLRAPTQAPGYLYIVPPVPAPNAAMAPRMLAPPPMIPTLPAQSYFQQPEQFQAAKYFTFIFFGLSVFVILLFGGFVVCHCYRRLRFGIQERRQPDAEAPQMVSEQNGAHEIVIPMKEGRLVTNPDGGLDIAYIPDAPKSSPVRAESGKALSSEGTPQDGAAAESVSDQRSRPAAEAPSSASSLPAPPLPVSASAVTGEAATETASLERRSWFRMPFGRTSPSTPWPSSGNTAQNEREDQYWRQRHAQLYQIF